MLSRAYDQSNLFENKIKMNKNGFVVVPILIWFAIAAFVIFGISRAGSFNHSNQNPDTLTDNQMNQLSGGQPQPTVEQTNPTQGSIDGIIVNPSPTSTDSLVTHNGSRTGKIIDYFELNSGKTIKVYENELLPFTDIKGKLDYYTQKDIDWSKKIFGDPNDPVETCHSSVCGDKQLKKSQCNTEVICCTVSNQSAWLTKDGCNNVQNQFAPKQPSEQEKQQAEKQTSADLQNAYQKCIKCSDGGTDYVNHLTNDQCYAEHKQYCDSSMQNGCFWNGYYCGDGSWPF